MNRLDVRYAIFQGDGNGKFFAAGSGKMDVSLFQDAPEGRQETFFFEKIDHL